MRYSVSTDKKGGVKMQEIQVPNNKTKLTVYINGVPDVSEVHPDDMTVWASVLDKTLTEHIENYNKRKARDRPEKKKVS